MKNKDQDQDHQLIELFPLSDELRDEDLMDDLITADELMAEEDYESVFEWAFEHHEESEPMGPAQIQKVMECYRFCMNYDMPMAAFNLGTIYFNGKYVPKDYAEAAKLYETAAKGGVSQGYYNVGYSFYHGLHQDKDLKTAYEWFLKGALLYNNSSCLCQLGDMYLKGEAVPKDPVAAFRLYERAMNTDLEMEEEENRFYYGGDIKVRVARCLYAGIGCQQDLPEAHRLIHEALMDLYEDWSPYRKDSIKEARKLAEDIMNELDQTIQ